MSAHECRYSFQLSFLFSEEKVGLSDHSTVWMYLFLPWNCVTAFYETWVWIFECHWRFPNGMLSWNLGTFLELSGPLQACNVIALPFTFRKYSGQYTRVGCWVQWSEILFVSNGQQLVVPGERRVVFYVWCNCHVALLQDHLCSMLDLCTFAFARVTDTCAEHSEEWY